MNNFFRSLFLVLFLCGVAFAHPPENGIYPTTKQEWSGCCHNKDCYWTYVDVSFDGNRAFVHTPLGDFTINRQAVHQITQPGAREHICTLRAEAPREDGANVLCVFWSVGLQ